MVSATTSMSAESVGKPSASAVLPSDGNSIVFNSDKKGLDDLYRKSLAVEAEAELLYGSEKRLVAEAWSHDGRYIAYVYDPTEGGGTVEGGGGIMLLPLAEKKDPIPVVQGKFTYDEPEFSPDDKWIAYVCDESGSDEVYIRPLDGRGERRPISNKGGTQPQWRGDGKELFYLSLDGALMSVELRGQSFTPSVPQTLFQTNLNVNPGLDQYAATRDGKRFLMVANPLKAEKATKIAFVLNWLEELKQRVPFK